MQLSGWKYISFGSHRQKPQCKYFFLSSRWGILTSLMCKFYHWCLFALCRGYITQIIYNSRFLIQYTCFEVGIRPDRKWTAWVVEHSRYTCNVYIMHDISLYVAAFIFYKQQDIWCTYMGKFHVVVFYLNDKNEQCVHCDKAKHGISHDWGVLSYNEVWHISPTPKNIGG